MGRPFPPPATLSRRRTPEGLVTGLGARLGLEPLVVLGARRLVAALGLAFAVSRRIVGRFARLALSAFGEPCAFTHTQTRMSRPRAPKLVQYSA
eukprot:493978-Rhodomonas_salina.5